MMESIALLLTCYSVLHVSAELQPPKNLRLVSENFQHILTWEDPNNESLIYHSVLYSQMFQKFVAAKECVNITRLRCDLTKDFTSINYTYRVKVLSFTKQGTSYASKLVSLTPIQETVLGPPIVDIIPCNCCIQVSVQPPVSHLWSNEEQRYLSMVSDTVFPILQCTIKIMYMTEVSSYEVQITTDNYTFTQPNLIPKANYCVSVSVTAGQNSKPSIPSKWKCALTEYLVNESSKVYILLPVVICSILLLIGIVLFLVGLDRAGYICKMKTIFPKALKSLPTSESTFTERSDFSSPTFSLPVEIISRTFEVEQKPESEKKSLEEGYTNRKKLTDSDQSGATTSGEFLTSALSSDGSSGQTMSSPEGDVSVGQLGDGMSSGDSKLGSFTLGHVPAGVTDDSSNLPINTGGVFNINLNTVSITDPVWTVGKEPGFIQEPVEDSAQLHKTRIVLDQHNVGFCLGIEDLEEQEYCSDSNEEQDTSENSDSDSHLISGYMRR